MNCPECRFSRLLLEKDTAGQLVCARFPPSASASLAPGAAGQNHIVKFTSWPNVKATDRCGEFAPMTTQ